MAENKHSKCINMICRLRLVIAVFCVGIIWLNLVSE